MYLLILITAHTSIQDKYCVLCINTILFVGYFEQNFHDLINDLSKKKNYSEKQIITKSYFHRINACKGKKIKNKNHNNKYLTPYLIIKLMSKAIRVV